MINDDVMLPYCLTLIFKMLPCDSERNCIKKSFESAKRDQFYLTKSFYVIYTAYKEENVMMFPG